MIKLRIFFTSIFCFLAAMNSYSQQSSTSVSGTIIDENNQPVLSAIVIHMETQSGRVIKNTLVDKNGYFRISNIKPNLEKVKITAMGYQEIDLVADSLKENSQIMLRPLVIGLNEVVVLGKSTVVQKSDRLVFNISNSNITKGNSTYELLRFTPLVRVEDETISLIGKSSILLYINGRDSRLSGNSALQYLRSLPAEKIARVEVISNPMSTFRTSGNEGIINLILKKNEGDGLKGTISFDESYQYTNSFNGSMYLFYQKNKLNITANLYGGNRRFYTKTKTEHSYFDTNKYNVVESTNDPDNKQLGGNLTIDYNLSDKQTLGIMLNSGYQRREDDGISRTSYQQLETSIIDSIIYSSNLLRTPSYIFTGNLNYRIKTDDKGSGVALDVDYLHNYKYAKTFADFSYIANESIQPPHESFTQQSKDILNNYSARAEYKHIFDEKNELTTGLEGYTWNSGMNYFHGNLTDGVYVSDPLKSNIFNYKEAYGACFVSYSRIWSDKINSTIGARLEYNHVRGKQEMGDFSDIKRTHINLSPSLAILYSMNPDNRLSLNLSSFIARPSITHLNPFRFYTTPTTYIENDPNLKPATFYMMGLNYTLKRHYIIGVEYSYIDDCFNVFNIPEEGGFTKITRTNYGDATQLITSFSWNDSFWENRIYVNASARGSYFRYSGSVETTVINVKDFNYDLSFMSGVQVSKKYNWNIMANYIFKSKNELAHENNSAFNSVNINVKKVFSRNISLNFGVRNLFYTKMKREKTDENYRYKLTPLQNDRFFYVSLSIPFGNTKTKGAQYRKTSSSETSRRLRED